MNKTKYLQGDSRWGNLVYPKKPCYIKNVGCGEVSIANILIEMERYKNYTPATIQPYCKQFGASNCDGTYLSGICKMMKHYGLTDVKECTTMPALWKELEKGDRVAIYLMGNRKAGSKKIVWTSGGHFIASVAYKYENGLHKLYIKDPWTNASNRNGWLSYEEHMKNDVLGVYVGKLSGAKTDTASSTTTASTELTVDGIGGSATIKATQKYFGTTQDGVLSGQLKKLNVYYPSITAVEYGKNGSACVKALQKWLGLTQDGIIGQGTTAAWQKKLRDLGYLAKNETIDGIFGVKSMKAWQTFLNDKLFKEETKTDTNTDTNTSTNTNTSVATDASKPPYKVIDVSDWQGSIDWAKVKADGVVGAIIRYADGTTLDKRFAENMKNAKANGLHIGSYIFSRAKTKAEAEKEAQRLFDACKPYGLDMPMYIDLEVASLSKYANTVAQAFIAKIKELGGKPGVYANLNWWNNYLKSTAQLSFAMWLAQYNSTMDYKPASYVGMWQYSSSGKVNGISGKVDMDKCYIAYWDTETVQDKICDEAKRIANDGNFHYVKFVQKVTATHECPICKNHAKGTYYGWNCIGYPFHCWHSAIPKCKCSCGVMTNQMYEKMVSSSAKDALAIAQKRTGLTDIEVITSKSGIDISKLQKGDIIAYFNGDTYVHTALYLGDGKIADCTSGRTPNIKYGVKSYTKWKIKVAIRYIGK